MTGPEHYQEAERLLRLVARSHGGSEFTTEALAHAVLALAAATAFAETGPSGEQYAAWRDAVHPYEGHDIPGEVVDDA